MENMTFTFNLTFAQANVILKHLGAGSYAEVESIIAAIRDQATAQMQAAANSQIVEEAPTE
jgi:hypothetical protein